MHIGCVTYWLWAKYMHIFTYVAIIATPLLVVSYSTLFFWFEYFILLCMQSNKLALLIQANCLWKFILLCIHDWVLTYLLKHKYRTYVRSWLSTTFSYSANVISPVGELCTLWTYTHFLFGLVCRGRKHKVKIIRMSQPRQRVYIQLAGLETEVDGN